MIQISMSDDTVEKLLDRYGEDFVDLLSSIIKNRGNEEEVEEEEYEEDSDEDEDDDDDDDGDGDEDNSGDEGGPEGKLFTVVHNEGFVNENYTLVFERGGKPWKGVLIGNTVSLYRINITTVGKKEYFLVAEQDIHEKSKKGDYLGGALSTSLESIKIWFASQVDFRLLEGEPVIIDNYFSGTDYTVEFDYFDLSWRGTLVRISKTTVRAELYLVFNPTHKQSPHVGTCKGSLNNTPSLVSSTEISVEGDAKHSLPSYQKHFFYLAKDFCKINSGEVKDLDYFYVGRTSKIDNYDLDCREVQIALIKKKCPSDFEVIEVLPNTDLMKIDVRVKFEDVIWKVFFDLEHTRGTSHYSIGVQSGLKTSAFEVLEKTPFSFHSASLLYITFVEVCTKIRLLIDKYRDANSPQSLVFFGNPFVKENLPEGFKLTKKFNPHYSATLGMIKLDYRKKTFLVEYNVKNNEYSIAVCEGKTDVTSLDGGKLTDLLQSNGNIIERMDAQGIRSLADTSFLAIKAYKEENVEA